MEQKSEVRSQRSVSRRRGVALMDVIVGSVILSIGLGVLMSLSARSLAAQSDGEKRIIAAHLADEILNMVVVDGPVDFPRRNDLSGTFREPFAAFSYDLAIQDEGLGLPFRVTATISWLSGRRAESVQVQTQIAEQEAPPEPRAPNEMVDRFERWYGDDQSTE